MNLRHLALWVWLAVPASALAQTVPDPGSIKPDFRVIVQGTFDPETLAEFNRRVQEYSDARNRLEAGLRPLVVTTDADEIESFERRLTERIHHARGSRRGTIFLPAMERQIEQMLAAHADAGTIAAVMDDNPGEFHIDVGETYKKKHSLATMPLKLLLLLPDLPRDLEYRFVGRHLILRDARANAIIDEIPYAIRCRDCVPHAEKE